MLEHWGYIQSRPTYYEILHQADFVLSTALHDFQGLSVLEAVAHKCVPIVPHNLAYGEYFDTQYLYQVHQNNLQTASQIVAKLRQFIANKPPAPSIKQLSPTSLLPQYGQWLTGFLSPHRRHRDARHGATLQP